MIIGAYVEALQDGCVFKKGTIGVIDNMWEGGQTGSLFIGVKVNGRLIGPSLAEYWKVVPASKRRINF